MNRNRTSFRVVLLVLTAAGCINLPDIEPDAPQVEEPLPDLGVRLLTPGATTYTNSTVDVSVEVTNGTPEAVELFAGNELQATLTSPYTYRWDTTAKPEGTYTLTAKARRGAQTFTSEARQVVVDRTPPQVVIMTPEAGARGVRARHPIQAVISEPLNPGSANNASTQMTANGNDVVVSVQLSFDGRVLTIVPTVAVALPAQVEITLTDGIRDLAGNSLTPLSVGWSWNVPDFFFVEDVLRVNGQAATNPSIQLGAFGKPIVASVVGDYGYVQRWTGSSWERVGGALKANPESTVYRPFLQLNSSGSPVVAWNEVTSNGSDVYVWRWAGSNWESVGSALSVLSGNTPASAPALQLDPAGNPIIAFMEHDGQARNLYVRRWNGSAWDAVGGALSAKPGNTHVDRVSLRLDPAGNPIVAWMELGDGVYNTAYVSRWLNGQWTMLGSVLGPSPGSNFIDTLSLAVDAAGNPVIVIFQNNGMTPSPRLSVLRWVGEQWTALGGSLTNYGVDPIVQVDATGRPVVAWAGSSSATANIYFKRWTGTDWESLGGALSAQPGSSAYSASFQLNTDGYPVVAWSELGPESGVYVASFNY